MISVVIATCDRPDRLALAANAVAKAATQSGVCRELIVVDNGVCPLRDDVVRAFQCPGSFSIRCIRSSPGDKSAALNRGIRATQTEWIAFTDDDCIPDEDWILRGVEYVETGAARFFGGRVLCNAEGDALPRWLRPGRSRRIPLGPAIVSYAPIAESGFLPARTRVPLGANVFVKREIFERYGFYDETLWRRCGRVALGCEDAEFGMRLQRFREPVGYCSEAIVEHPVYPERATWCHHAKWAFRMGVRESFVFADGARGSTDRWLLRSMSSDVVKAATHSVCGDWAAVVCDGMAFCHALGVMSGKRAAARAGAAGSV